MWAPLLGRAAVFAALWALSTCLTAGSQLCPRSLDCARAGRHFCPQGSSRCGPCLRPLVENARGHCSLKRRHVTHSTHQVKGQIGSYPELDEEIDILSAVISESRFAAPPSDDVSEPLQNHGASVTGAPTSQSPTTPTNNSSAHSTAHASTNHTSPLLGDPVILPHASSDHVFIVVSSVFMVVASLALILAAAIWLRLHKGVYQKMAPPFHPLLTAQSFQRLPGDKKLAHNAQMYHYQHQKQQMLSLEKHRDEPKVPDSGASTDEENEDGDFTVYECPGLAPTGEMEVKNPLFDDTPLYLHKFH